MAVRSRKGEDADHYTKALGGRVEGLGSPCRRLGHCSAAAEEKKHQS